MKHDIYNELSTNFIEYAVAVNTDRSIPDSKSGLKPVATRILYGAFEGGRSSAKPHVKSARVVGEVMGTYHPHGDTSIYGAMVRLAQPWAMRYPLMDGHGNFGNVGGDGPAAMRYTEIRLSKLAEDGLLYGLKKRNVEFKPNYDETTEEPVTLPAIFPNLLCNPNTGIGVAMACNWLPHNLTETAQAIFDYIDGKEPMLPGPDFPTGGLIINKNDIPAIMRAGRGSVKVRSRYKTEKNSIIFYEIPYGTTTENLLTELGEVCEKKEVEGVIDIRDESNKKGIRIVVECEKGSNLDAIANKIYLKTDFQTSISYNQVALVNKVPTELNLTNCIKIYIDHNIDCLIKECNFDLAKAQERKEIVEGLLKALEDIDNIIALIKASESSAAAKVNLQTKYGFTEAQAKAIVDMKLGKLAGLEKIELQNENAELANRINEINNILSSKDNQINVIRERLSSLVKKYGDARRTVLEQIEIPKEEKEIVTITPEDCVVIVSQSGLVKRVPVNNFKVQKRNGKGIKNEDDAALDMISTNTIDTLMLFTNKGKMYRILVDKIPAGTTATKGTPIANLISLELDEKIIAVTSLFRKTNAQYAIFITKQGLFKKTALSEYTSFKKGNGYQALKLKENDSLANVTFCNEEEFIVVTKNGKAIRFETTLINPIGRVTSGVKAIKLDEGDEVLVGLPIHKNSDSLFVVTSDGLGKKTSLEEYPVQGRGGKGINCSGTSIVGAILISDEDNLFLSGMPNSICISAKDVPSVGRTSLGNILIKNSQVKRVVKI